MYTNLHPLEALELKHNVYHHATIDLAVIVPVYNEGDALSKNLAVIRAELDQLQLNYKIVLIDDGSKDHTWQVVQGLSRESLHILGVRFARNFGKELAIFAGLEHIKAKKYLVMDSDLQHPPKHIGPMLTLMESEQADIVDGVKSNRGKESALHRFVAKRFYKTLKALSGLELDNSSDFKLLDGRVVLAILQFKERSLFFRGMVDWVGFKRVNYDFEVEERGAGSSKFSPRALFKLALVAILSHTSKPLYLTLFTALAALAIALILGTQTLINYFLGRAIGGFTTVILIMLLLGAMILFTLGIIGMYIARIYDEVKGRPQYVVSAIQDQEAPR